MMFFKDIPSAVQGCEFFGRELRWIKRFIYRYLRLRVWVSVRTIRRGSDVDGSKSRIQWGSQAVQVFAPASIYEKDGDSQQ
jgi:hypothetical protein